MKFYRQTVHGFVAVIMLANVGCAMLQEPPFELPTGTPATIADIPAEVVAPGTLPAGTKAQRYGDSEVFRLEYPDGSIKILGPHGQVRGGVL